MDDEEIKYRLHNWVHVEVVELPESPDIQQQTGVRVCATDSEVATDLSKPGERFFFDWEQKRIDDIPDREDDAPWAGKIGVLGEQWNDFQKGQPAMLLFTGANEDPPTGHLVIADGYETDTI